MQRKRGIWDGTCWRFRTRSKRSVESARYEVEGIGSVHAPDTTVQIPALMPCRPSKIDIDSLAKTLATLKTLRKAAAGLVVLTQAPPVKNSAVIREARHMIEAMGAVVSPAIIRYRMAFQHSRNSNHVVAEYEPEGAAAAEIAYLLNDLTSRYREVSKS